MLLINCLTRCCKNYGRQPQEARNPTPAQSIDNRAQAAAANSFSGAVDHQPNTSLRHRGSTGSDAAAGAGTTASVVSQEPLPDCPLSQKTIQLAHSKGVTLAQIYNVQEVTVFLSERPNENAILYFAPSNPELPLWQCFIIKDSVAESYSRLTNNLDRAIGDQLHSKFPSTATQFVERTRQESKWPPESKQNEGKWPVQPNPNANTSYSGAGPGPAAVAGQYKAIEAPVVATAVAGGQPPVLPQQQLNRVIAL